MCEFVLFGQMDETRAFQKKSAENVTQQVGEIKQSKIKMEE